MTYYKQITNKLFYNEFPYKITVRLNGSYHLRKHKNLEIPDQYLKEIKLFYKLGQQFTQHDIETIKNFADTLKLYLNKDVKLRYDHKIGRAHV